MNMRRSTLLVATLFGFAACGGSNSGSGGGGSGSGSGGGSGSAGGGSASGGGGGSIPGGGVQNPDGSYTIHFTLPAPIPAGTENTQCITVPLGNAAAMHINQIHDQLGAGSHHMIVYKVSADTPVNTTPVDCQPFSETLDPSKGEPLAITQKSDETINLPTGVGISLDANQLIRFEMHYINATTQPITLIASTTLYPMSDADYMQEAGFVFMGDIDINMTMNGVYSVPANNSDGSNSGVFLPVPANLAGVANFFALTGHEHQWGTGVTIATATSSTDAPGTMVYDVPNWLWSEPATVYPSPTFQVASGGGFRLHCTWDNESGGTVKFGESANNEMCFFWAYYYPNQGAEVCFHSDKYASLLGGSGDVCCPDSQNVQICNILASGSVP